MFMTQNSSFSNLLRVITLFLLIVINSTLLYSCKSREVQEKPLPPQNESVIRRDTTIEYHLGSRLIKIKWYNYTDKSGIIYINLHDDENTSVEATKEIISKNKGSFIELQAQNKREISFDLGGKTYTFDPNRIFTSNGIEKTLEKYGSYRREGADKIGEFAGFLTGMLNKYQKIVAVHNNKRGYSIKDYLQGGQYQNDSELTFWNDKASPNDFFYVTEKQHFDFFKNKNLSVVLQNGQSVTDDGSLSVYCGLNNLVYINSEAMAGHLKEQIKMLQALQEIL
jgi:hypothetical protein